MAEYLLVPDARHLVPLPDGLDPVHAAPLTDAGLTPYHAVRRSRASWPRSIAVVIGVGGLGHIAVQVLRATAAAGWSPSTPATPRATSPTQCGADVALSPGPTSRLRSASSPTGSAPTSSRLRRLRRDPGPAAAAARQLGDITVVGIAGGTLPVSFFSRALRDGVQTTYWGTGPSSWRCSTSRPAGCCGPRPRRFPLDGPPGLRTCCARRGRGRAVVVPNEEYRPRARAAARGARGPRVVFGNTSELRQGYAGASEPRVTSSTSPTSPRRRRPASSTVELLVLGAPTHAFSLSRAGTRADAVRQGAPTRTETGVREWLGAAGTTAPPARPHRALRHPGEQGAAAPRLGGPQGGAPRPPRRALAPELGTESFYVEDVGVRCYGELDRARTWGRRLVERVSTAPGRGRLEGPGTVRPDPDSGAVAGTPSGDPHRRVPPRPRRGPHRAGQRLNARLTAC